MLSMCKYKKELLLILTFALILRATLSVVTVFVNKSERVFLTSDTGTYVAPAKSLIESRSFDFDGKPFIFRTPGYPLLLVPGILVGKMLLVTIGLQILISCLTVAVVFELALELFSSRKIAIIAALLYASEPLSIIFCSFLMAETLFTFFLASFVLCFVKYLHKSSVKFLIMAAAMLSASVYVRPVSYYLPWCVSLGMLLLMVIQRRKLTRVFVDVFVFFAISATLIGVWQIRNYKMTGFGGFASVGGHMFYRGNYRPLMKLVSTEKNSDYVKTHLSELDLKLFSGHTQEKGSSYQYMKDGILKIIHDNPAVVVSFYLKKVAKYFLAPGAIQMLNLFNIKVPKRVVEEKIGKSILEKRRLYLEKAPIYFWADALFGVWLVSCLIFASVAVLSKNIWKKIPFWLIICVIGYFAVVSCGALTFSRMRHPIMPLLCVLAAFGARRLIKGIMGKVYQRKLVNSAKPLPC